MNLLTRRILIYSMIALVGIFLIGVTGYHRRNLMWAAYTRLQGRYTVEERLDQYGKAARARLRPFFEKAKQAYPPACVVLLVFKQERRMEVYAGPSREAAGFIRMYRVKGASGTQGPKLREGDCQVPEGLYRVESLNPNSCFHLSLRLNYPNEFDKRMAESDGRTDLGGDIMIHGGTASIGCLAMGDEAVEDLFVLAADTGIENFHVVISPFDFRSTEAASMPNQSPAWIGDLHETIRGEVSRYTGPG